MSNPSNFLSNLEAEDSGQSPQQFSQPVQHQSVVHHHHHSGAGSGSNVAAAICSFFIPGLGQLVQGRLGAGLVFLFADFVAFILCFVGIGFFLLPVIWIWAVVDAAIYQPRRLRRRSYR